MLKKKTTNAKNEDLYKLMVDNEHKPKLSKKYRDQLIINNTRLVVKKVLQYIKSNKLMIFDDMLQEGIIGLASCIDTYNPNLKFNFSTWASIHIKKKILRFMDSLYMPKPHTQITENIDRVRKIVNKLENNGTIRPTPIQVKNILDGDMRAKSKYHKKLNKERIGKSLTPLSETIGIDKFGKFTGVNISIIEYIMDNINNRKIIHSIDIETKSAPVTSELESISDVNADSIIGNIFFNEMYEEVFTLMSSLCVKDGEIIDLLLGISYERPYTLREISTILYNYYDNSEYYSTIPRASRMAKEYFNKLKKISK